MQAYQRCMFVSLDLIFQREPHLRVGLRQARGKQVWAFPQWLRLQRLDSDVKVDNVTKFATLVTLDLILFAFSQSSEIKGRNMLEEKQVYTNRLKIFYNRVC